MKKKFIIPLLIFCFPCTLKAQLPGIKDSIWSASLKEQRMLQVQLPKEYKPGSSEKYSVLYLLDGEWNAGLMQQVQAWSRQWEFTPPIIMVGIVNSYANNNNQRGRDLTPTAVPAVNNSGGAPALLSFIKNELIPYVNKTYPSNGSNILWGHSFGGLFVLYALFTEPQLFGSYIAADPSVGWDNGYILKLANEKLPALKQVRSLFITGRTGRPYHGMGIDSIEMLLQQKAPPNLQWKTVAYPDETHISQQYKSAYDGLKYSLAPLFNHERIRIDPMGGIVVKDQPFNLSCDNVLPQKYLHYTTDGTEPVLSSPVLNAENELQLKGSTALRISSFFPDEADNRSFTAQFTSGKALSPFPKPRNLQPGAVKYACFKDPAATQALSAGILTPEKDINQLDKSDSFYCHLSGYLETVKAGYYIFEMAGEQGTKFFLGNQLLMEISAGSDYQSFMIPLEQGFYPIRIECYHRKDGHNFDFRYVVPGATDDGPVPPSALYYVP